MNMLTTFLADKRTLPSFIFGMQRIALLFVTLTTFFSSAFQTKSTFLPACRVAAEISLSPQQAATLAAGPLARSSKSEPSELGAYSNGSSSATHSVRQLLILLFAAVAE